jgi:outer membrane receptor protein involved in Fe transport
VHGGNSYRAPSTYERFGGGSGTYYGDPRLESERSVSIDGGIDQWLFDSKLQVSATLFRTEIREMIRFANSLPPGDPFGRFFGYENGGRGHASGVELSAQASPTRQTRAQFAYTYAVAESQTATFGTDYFRILGSAPHTFAMSMTQFATPRFHATFDLYTKSSYNTTLFGASGRLSLFDGPTKANLVLGYEFPLAGDRGVEIYTKVENIFDERPYEDGFIGPDRWAIVGVRLRY